jgi:ribosomal protein S9
VHENQEQQKTLAAQMNEALHELSQPLTVLQCRLAMGELSGEQGAMREAIAEALLECTRANMAVSLMRETLQQALQADGEEQERKG